MSSSLAQSIQGLKLETPFGRRAPNLLASVYGDEEQQKLARSVLLGPHREVDYNGARTAHTWVEVCPGHFATYTLIQSHLLVAMANDLRSTGMTDVLLHEPIGL